MLRANRLHQLFANTLWACIWSLVAVSIYGCQSKGVDNSIQTVPVQGLVTIDGEPADGVSIVCLRTNEIPPDAALGNINIREFAAMTTPDGRFSLDLYRHKRGIPEGEYALSFIWLKLVDSPSSLDASKDFLKGKYNNIAKSPKKFTVTIGNPVNLEDINLTTK